MSDLPVPRALRALSDVSDPGERYRTLPDGYRVGQARYLIITGSVMSGLGKGIFSAGLARLLADRGFSTNLIKMDGYYNEDAGTLSPYRHGEVFVLDDGTECDMDIGTYERFLGRSLSHHNYFTNGKLSQRINALERGGQFSGSDVQFFPHVTGELVRFVRESTLAAGADITLVEIGGTVGDEENRTYISAMSDLAYQEGERNVFFINLVWIIEARHLNEQKSKAAQHGTQLLMQMGIKPQMLVCRAENAVEPGVRQKLADRLRMPVRNVIDLHNQSSIYRVPGHLQEQQVDQICLEYFGLGSSPAASAGADGTDGAAAHTPAAGGLMPAAGGLQRYLHALTRPRRTLRIGIAGKYLGPRDTYASIHNALEHAGTHRHVRVEVVDVPSDLIDAAGSPAQREEQATEHLSDLDGLVVPGGFGRRGWEGKIACVTHARLHGLPMLGICYGFQAAMVEFARHCCDLPAANTQEVDPRTDSPIILLLPEQYKIEGIGGSMRLGKRTVKLRGGSAAARLYAADSIEERFRHRYELNPLYRELLETHGMVFSGWAPGQPIVQVAELPTHPFYLGVQYHPEFLSRPGAPSPLFAGLIDASLAGERRAVRGRQRNSDRAASAGL
ncbi:MAG: CTP synthase [Spirochaetaceae bacterium]|nr:CTP synthase [Spirochaetaceae bacterium]